MDAVADLDRPLSAATQDARHVTSQNVPRRRNRPTTGLCDRNGASDGYAVAPNRSAGRTLASRSVRTVTSAANAAAEPNRTRKTAGRLAATVNLLAVVEPSPTRAVETTMTTTGKARFASLPSDTESAWGGLDGTSTEPQSVSQDDPSLLDALTGADGYAASWTARQARSVSPAMASSLSQETGVDRPAEPALSEDTWSDEELLICYRTTGRRSLFDLLVRRYEREIYSYLCRYLGNADMAEDVFQATFLSVHLKCDQFEPGRKVRPWLYAVATNAAIDAQRRSRRHRLVSLDRVRTEGSDRGTLADLMECPKAGPAEEFAQREQGEWVQKALSEMTDQMRSVLNLVYYQGLKYREAAEILQVPVGTVKSRIHAAVQKLSEFWDKTETQ